MKKLRSMCERTFDISSIISLMHDLYIAELVIKYYVVYVNEILGLKICQKFKSYPNSNHISIKKKIIFLLLLFIFN